MKNFLFFSFLITTLVCESQTQWDYLGGLPIEMNSTLASCMYFDFEQNGSNEVKIVHGIDVGCYFTSCTNVQAYTPTHAKTEDKAPFWSDCTADLSGWTSDTAYISKNESRLDNGSHVLPFKYGNKYGFFVLKLDAGSEILKVRGYVFLINPKNFNCYVIPESRSRNVETYKE